MRKTEKWGGDNNKRQISLNKEQATSAFWKQPCGEEEDLEQTKLKSSSLCADCPKEADCWEHPERVTMDSSAVQFHGKIKTKCVQNAHKNSSKQITFLSIYLY